MHVMTNSRGGGKEGKLRACSRFKRKKDEDADSVPKEKREEEEEKIFFSHKIRTRNCFRISFIVIAEFCRNWLF